MLQEHITLLFLPCLVPSFAGLVVTDNNTAVEKV